MIFFTSLLDRVPKSFVTMLICYDPPCRWYYEILIY